MKKHTRTVCLIDDDPIFIFGAKKLMERASFCDEVLVYTNGKEAIDALTLLMQAGPLTAVPDIIFLDLNMPIIDGWGFLDEFVLIKPQKEIVIYIVTSSVSSADRKRALGYSETVKDYVIKPISPIRMNEIFEKYKKEEEQ